MRERSLSTVVSSSPRRQALERAVRDYAQVLLTRHPEVVDVIWFGSWVTGQPSRYSDVDLCLLLSSSPLARLRDRIPLYLPDRFPSGLDLFPYTTEEFHALETELPRWWQTIRSGWTVASRKSHAV